MSNWSTTTEVALIEPIHPGEVFLRPLRPGDAADVLAAFISSADMARQGDVANLSDAQRYVANLLAD